MSHPAAAEETAPSIALQAQAAFSAGQVELARALALAALQEDSGDPMALAVLAAVGLATNEPEAARKVARWSFKEGESDQDKFTAARLAARASVEMDQLGIAKYWLRRAVQVAPSDEAKAATVADFLAVRSKSRLRVDLSFSITPSDNVNQGSEDNLLTIDGHPTWFIFDPSTMALSGVETTGSVSFAYRIAGTAVHPTEIGLRAYHRGVTLSSEAKAQAPGAKGEDFSNSALDVFVLRKMALGSDKVLSTGFVVGSTWLAGDPYSDRARADISLTKSYGRDKQARVGFAVERQWLDSGKPSATVFTLDAGYLKRRASGDIVAVKLEMGQTVSDDANQENRKLGLSVRYIVGEPVAGARISAGLTAAARDYPVFFNGIFNDTGREDLTVAASLEVALPDLGLFGFEPVLSLEASRTESNVSRYTGQAAGIGLRIQSSF